jgi:two-component system, OmpR family, response regulator
MGTSGLVMTLSKILLVDDDDNIRAIAEISLEDDYKVVVASSGAEALVQAEKLMPDLILLDVMMPGMDGKATFAKLQENPALAGIPVIFMTAKVLSHEIDFYLGLGAAGVITKPFDPMRLGSDIQEIWARCKG